MCSSLSTCPQKSSSPNHSPLILRNFLNSSPYFFTSYSPLNLSLIEMDVYQGHPQPPRYWMQEGFLSPVLFDNHNDGITGLLSTSYMPPTTLHTVRTSSHLHYKSMKEVLQAACPCVFSSLLWSPFGAALGWGPLNTDVPQALYWVLHPWGALIQFLASIIMHGNHNLSLWPGY